MKSFFKTITGNTLVCANVYKQYIHYTLFILIYKHVHFCSLCDLVSCSMYECACFIDSIHIFSGNIVSPDVIMSHLKYILADERPPNENPIGVLTTLNRDKWATVRAQLCNAGENRSRS